MPRLLLTPPLTPSSSIATSSSSTDQSTSSILDDDPQFTRILILSNLNPSLDPATLEFTIHNALPSHRAIRGINCRALASDGTIPVVFFDLRDAKFIRDLILKEADTTFDRLAANPAEKLGVQVATVQSVEKKLGTSPFLESIDASFYLTVHNNDKTINTTILLGILKSFGSLRHFTFHHHDSDSHSLVYHIEYHDSRDGEKASNELPTSSSIFGMTFSVSSTFPVSEKEENVVQFPNISSDATPDDNDKNESTDNHLQVASTTTIPDTPSPTFFYSSYIDSPDDSVQPHPPPSSDPATTTTTCVSPCYTTTTPDTGLCLYCPSRYTAYGTAISSPPGPTYYPNTTPSEYFDLQHQHPPPQWRAFDPALLSFMPPPPPPTMMGISMPMPPIPMHVHPHPHPHHPIPIPPPGPVTHALQVQPLSGYYLGRGDDVPAGRYYSHHQHERFSGSGKTGRNANNTNYSNGNRSSPRRAGCRSAAATTTTTEGQSRYNPSSSSERQDSPPPLDVDTNASHPTTTTIIINDRNVLDLTRIEEGLDTRTTVMIKNIPNKMSDKDLLAYIGAVCPRRIDFFYLRMDFQNGCNVGYAFVNFIGVQDLLRFARAKLGVKWNMFSSEKVLQMSYANYQGKEALVEKFKNSAIMDERESWRPRIFFSSGPHQGLPEPFPPPTHMRRKERSWYNRGALFVPGNARDGHHGGGNMKDGRGGSRSWVVVADRHEGGEGESVVRYSNGKGFSRGSR